MECQQNFRQSSWGSEVGGAKNERYMYICIYNAIGTNIEQIWLEHNFEYWIWYILKKNVYSDGVMIICSFNICMCVKLPSLAYPRLLFKYWMHNENCIPIISFQSSISIQITHFNESFTSYCLGQLSHILKNKFILF